MELNNKNMLHLRNDTKSVYFTGKHGIEVAVNYFKSKDENHSGRYKKIVQETSLHFMKVGNK